MITGPQHSIGHSSYFDRCVNKLFVAECSFELNIEYQSIVNGFTCHVRQDQYWPLFQVCTLMFQYCSNEKHVCFVNMCNSTTLTIRDWYILKYHTNILAHLFLNNRSNLTALTQNISYMLPISAGYNMQLQAPVQNRVTCAVITLSLIPSYRRNFQLDCRVE